MATVLNEGLHSADDPQLFSTRILNLWLARGKLNGSDILMPRRMMRRRRVGWTGTKARFWRFWEPEPYRRPARSNDFERACRGHRAWPEPSGKPT